MAVALQNIHDDPDSLLPSLALPGSGYDVALPGDSPSNRGQSVEDC